jgi:hypothetical protein
LKAVAKIERKEFSLVGTDDKSVDLIHDVEEDYLLTWKEKGDIPKVEPHRYTDNDRFVAYWVIKTGKERRSGRNNGTRYFDCLGFGV